ncbi:MAG: hypothetical protein K2H53_02555 [Clostridia bacterium]|nr:hypothetical protein [Clostridia bacterium]
MVTIQFELNENSIKRSGYTKRDVENYLNKFFVVKRKCKEVSYLTYQRDDKNAMCNIGDIIPIMGENPQMMDLFSKCIWNVDGTVEDLITIVKKCIKKYGT